jgi:allantoate deiminase
MAIQVERIRQDIQAIARCTETPGAGASRPTFSKAWGEARQYVAAQARAAGCVVRIDAMANLHARPAALDPATPVWLSGSHLDSVPHGGDYDGVLGVVVALELLRSAHEDGRGDLPLELIGFAEEEGSTFGLGMLGARSWLGQLDAPALDKLRNSAGQSYLSAGAAYGVAPEHFIQDRFNPAAYLGLLEAHVEQGPHMWMRNERLAVVRAIAGRRQYRAVIHGEANHAGAASMIDRCDALAGTAQIMIELESLARRLPEQAVITVGRVLNHPNAVNVVPDRVEFTIDFRAASDAVLDDGAARIRQTLAAVCQERSLTGEIAETESAPARPMDARLCEKLTRAAAFAGVKEVHTAVSGALHDSAVMSPHLPTAMLFIASKGGISHNPAEFSRVEDAAVAAAALEQLVRRPTLGQLNAMGRDAFVSVCGGFFEHSPWVPESAWAARPFSSLAQLHETLCQVVTTAPLDKRLALIRAHPDLVGRLAKEGRLTPESTAEQAGAGLGSLSEAEAATFDHLNGAYREKFGFPFVICVRQNRKEAILEAFPRRLNHTPDQEMSAALAEIYKIASLRLHDAIWED